MANLQMEMMTEEDRYKHHRYISTTGLLNEDGFEADADLEAVLKKLFDGAHDVSDIDPKCLAPLVSKVTEIQVVEMAVVLCDRLLHGGEEHRVISSAGLRTILSEVNNQCLAQYVLVSLSAQLIKGITISRVSREIFWECLGILGEVLQNFPWVIVPSKKFAVLMGTTRMKLLNALLSLLNNSEASVREKTVSCVASLAPSLSDDLLAEATVPVVCDLRSEGAKRERTCMNIQMIGALSCAVGYRIEPHLGDTVLVLINYCKSDEELREYSLQALESFLLRCPASIASYCDEILHLTLEYLSYDPSFTDNMEEEEYVSSDASWKVRRAAAKCLAALVVSRPEMLSKLYKEACTKLIERFEERDETVKMDVFSTFIELLRQTGNVTKGGIDTNDSRARWLLKQEVPKIVKSINRQLQEKSIETKVGAFSVLKKLVAVLPDCLADHIESLIPGIEKALNDESSTSNLKIEALTFTRLVLASHPPSVFHPYIKELSTPVLSAVGGKYYKVTAEALGVCGELVRVVRPNIQEFDFDFKPYVHPIYEAIMSQLKNQDQDREVKECAISCMGLVISTFGDNLSAELPGCLPVLVDRMGNETTRLTAVKAFADIAASRLHIDLSSVLENVIAELTAFLQKDNRALRQATLGTLNSLIAANGDRIRSSAYEVIIVELSALISDSDLDMTALALELCCTVMADRRSSSNVGEVLPQGLALVKSSLLQGQALMALQNFFVTLVDSATTSFEILLNSLLSSAKGVAKQALHSIAQCVAVLCLASGDRECLSTVQMLTEILQNDSSTNSAEQHLALLCLGEVGRRKDLSAHANIETVIIESFQSPFEEIKSAASYALGNVAVGNLSKYLPFILDQIDDQQKKQHLLIHSLKEVIVRQSVDKAEFQDSSVEKILELLFNHCESEEEDVRNAVAECLGKMALIEPAKLVPALKVRTTSPAAFTGATILTALKHSVVARPEKIDEIMYPEVSSFLMLIKDQDLHVRRAAVSALTTFARNKPNLIKGLLPELLPLLYDQTIVQRELIGIVDLEAFEPIGDDGLELRKAAFECVDALLDTCLDQVNPLSFIDPYLKSGLDDHYDVKMACHLILSKLADKCPSAVLAVLDSLVEPLQETINFKPKQGAVEVGRNEDMIRSALGAIAALDRISGGDSSHRFKKLMGEIKKSSTLSNKYSFVSK